MTHTPRAGWLGFDFHTNRAFLNAHGEEQRQLAAEARHGGRALTDKIAQRVSVLLTLDGADQAFVNERWHYNIDPAGGGWDWIARRGAEGRDESQDRVSQTEAEAMVEWPIYRAALDSDQTRADIVDALDAAIEDLAYRAHDRKDYEDEDLPGIDAKLDRWRTLQTILSTKENQS